MKNFLKTTKKGGYSALALLLAAVMLVSLSLPSSALFAQSNDDSTNKKAVIGAADGPTSIFVASSLAKDPKDRVLDGFLSVFKFERNPLRDVHLGETEMFEHLQDKGGSLSGQLANPYMPMLEDYLDFKIPRGMRFDWQLMADGETPFNSFLKMNLAVDKDDLVTFKTFANINKAQFSIPQLSKKVFGIDYSGDIAQKFNNSPIMQESAVEALQYVGSYLEVMKDNIVEKKSSKLEDLLTNISKYKSIDKAFKMYQNTWQIKPLDAKSFTVNGTQQVCDGYDITITKQATEDFFAELYFATQEDKELKKDLDEYYEEMVTYAILRGESTLTKEEFYEEIEYKLAELTNDIWRSDGLDQQFTMYLDNQNRAVSFFMPYEKYGDVMSLLIEKYGGVTLAENMKAILTLKDGDSTAKLVFNRQGKTNIVSSNMDINVVILNDDVQVFELTTKANENFKDNTWLFNVRAGDGDEFVTYTSNGTFSDIVKGKAYTVNLEEAKLASKDKTFISFSGNIKMTTEVGEIAPISSQFTDLLKMTEQDFEAAEKEFETNSEKLREKFDKYFMPSN